MASPEILIFTDSSSDLNKKTAEELKINVIPLTVTIRGEEFFDGETIHTSEIIDRMNSGDMPKTASPGNGVIEERFEMADGKQIVSVFISDKISGVMAHAKIAAEEIKPTPIIVDSGTTSMALGFLAVEAAELNLKGKTAIEIQEEIESMKQRTVAVVGLPTIKYVTSGGRWLAGSLLQIKPILMMYGGKLGEVEKVRTWRKTKERLAKIVQSLKFDQIAIMFGENDAEADEFISHIPTPSSNKILKVQMGSAILTHAGPQVLAVCGILTPDSPRLTPAMAASI